MRFSKWLVIHGWRAPATTGSTFGGSSRMCEIHECHSGVTCDALKSCCASQGKSVSKRCWGRGEVLIGATGCGWLGEWREAD